MSITEKKTEPEISISVIIPVYNNSATISYTLESLKNQTRKADEILIAYNKSEDGSLQIIRNFSAGLNLKIIELPETVKGPAASRNFAVKYAQCSWLAFTDADCAPLESWLQTAEQLIQKFKASAYTGSVTGYLPESAFDKYQAVFGLNIISSDELYTEFEIFKTFGHTANLIVNREIFNILQGFNESLFFAEDHDFCARLLLSETQRGLYFSNALQMRHIFRTDIKKFLRSVFYYNQAHVYLIKKYYAKLTVKFGSKKIIDCASGFPAIINLSGLSVKLLILCILCFAVSPLMIAALILYIAKINTRLFVKFNNAGICRNFNESYKFLLIYLAENFTGLAGETAGYIKNKISGNVDDIIKKNLKNM